MQNIHNSSSVYRYAKKGDVYEETNGQDGLQRDDKCLTPGVLRYYHSCNVTHFADTNDEFL